MLYLLVIGSLRNIWFLFYPCAFSILFHFLFVLLLIWSHLCFWLMLISSLLFDFVSCFCFCFNVFFWKSSSICHKWCFKEARSHPSTTLYGGMCNPASTCPFQTPSNSSLYFNCQFKKMSDGFLWMHCRRTKVSFMIQTWYILSNNRTDFDQDFNQRQLKSRLLTTVINVV